MKVAMKCSNEILAYIICPVLSIGRSFFYLISKCHIRINLYGVSLRSQSMLLVGIEVGSTSFPGSLLFILGTRMWFEMLRVCRNLSQGYRKTGLSRF